jgi:hypothetical protein
MIMAKLARLIYEANEFGWVELAQVGDNGRPSLRLMIDRMKELGAQKAVLHRCCQDMPLLGRTCNATPNRGCPNPYQFG